MSKESSEISKGRGLSQVRLGLELVHVTVISNDSKLWLTGHKCKDTRLGQVRLGVKVNPCGDRVDTCCTPRW